VAASSAEVGGDGPGCLCSLIKTNYTAQQWGRKESQGKTETMGKFTYAYI